MTKGKKYYFKYVVPSHYAEEYNSLAEAKRRAKELNEKIYLTIYHKDNRYREPYDEICLSAASRGIIKVLKKILIYSFLKITKEERNSQ